MAVDLTIPTIPMLPVRDVTAALPTAAGARPWISNDGQMAFTSTNPIASVYDIPHDRVITLDPPLSGVTYRNRSAVNLAYERRRNIIAGWDAAQTGVVRIFYAESGRSFLNAFANRGMGGENDRTYAGWFWFSPDQILCAANNDLWLVAGDLKNKFRIITESQTTFDEIPTIGEFPDNNPDVAIIGPIPGLGTYGALGIGWHEELAGQKLGWLIFQPNNSLEGDFPQAYTNIAWEFSQPAPANNLDLFTGFSADSGAFADYHWQQGPIGGRNTLVSIGIGGPSGSNIDVTLGLLDNTEQFPANYNGIYIDHEFAQPAFPLGFNLAGHTYNFGDGSLGKGILRFLTVIGHDLYAVVLYHLKDGVSNDTHILMRGSLLGFSRYHTATLNFHRSLTYGRRWDERL